MGNRTPNPTGGENVDTMTYKIPSTTKTFGGGTANLQGGSVPAVVVGGHSVPGQVPSLTGELTVGDLKNVSTPVTG